MAVNNVTTSTSVGVDGNKYTTAVNNDKLTNDDFLKLMLTELQYQDPTKPMNSEEMMNSQLKMSQIESHTQMAESMLALQQSFAQTSLSSATNIMGRTVENGTLTEAGAPKSFKVDTVELKEGEVYLNTREILGIKDLVLNPATGSYLNFNENGQIYGGNGELIDEFIPLENGKVVLDDKGKIVVRNGNGDVVGKTQDTEYTYKGSDFIYASEATTMSYNSVTKVF